MTQTRRQIWYADETNAIYLSKVLEDPKVKEALEVLASEGMAEDIHENGISADVLTKHALKHKELIGYNSFLTKLRALADKEPLPPEGTPNQYDDDYMAKWAKDRGYQLPPNLESAPEPEV